MLRYTVPTDPTPILLKHPKPLYIQKFVINPLELNIDYFPHKIGGNYSGAHLLNLFRI